MSDVQLGNKSTSFRTLFSKYTYHFGVIGCILVIGSFSYLIWLQRNRRKREIVLFTRYPVFGVTKTRLIPELGSVGASVTQTYMTEHILSTLKDLSVAFHNLNITVQYNGGTREDILYWLERRTKGMNINFKPQKGEGLGVKLKNAVKESFSKGHDYVIVIGGDIPGISKEILLEAVTHLNNSADMVLGKAADGGYYLVGFSKLAARYIDDIFSDISWGTSEVFSQQVLQAQQLGAKLGILTTVLQDVDNPEDLCVFERYTGVSVQNLKHPRWSIVIPTVNEGENIEKTLLNLVQRCSSTDKLAEIIISDGGSTDNTVEKIKGFIATSPVPVKLIHSDPGRGIQLRAGAEQAVGEYLLFLHGDTIVPKGFDKLAEQCLLKPGNVAGAFLFDLDIFHQDKWIMRLGDRCGTTPKLGILSPGVSVDSPEMGQESSWFKFKMKWIVSITRWRGRRRELPFGDQGLFMRRKMYEQVGGFQPLYLMEDYILVKELHMVGHVVIADGDPVITSSRRWRTRGLIKTTGLNQLIILAYTLGVHPNTLARWYYGNRLKKTS